MRIMMSGNRFALVIAATAIVALAACAPSATPPPAPAPTSAGPSAPDEVTSDASGDCEQLFDSAQLAAALGVVTDVIVGNDQLALGITGGFSCTYMFGEQGDPAGGQVQLHVAPEAIATANEVAGSLTAATCAPSGTDLMASNPGCKVTTTLDGWWYNLSVFTSGSADAQELGFEATVAVLEQSLSALGAPEAVAAIEPIDCASADTGGLAVASSTNPPDATHTPVAFAAFRVGGPTTCAFTTATGEQWSVDVYPHAASSYDRCTHPPMLGLHLNAAVVVPGVDSASERWWDAFGEELCATDGENLVTVRHGMDVAEASAWSSESLATAGSLIVPIFAAID